MEAPKVVVPQPQPARRFGAPPQMSDFPSLPAGVMLCSFSKHTSLDLLRAQRVDLRRLPLAPRRRCMGPA
mgnify:CR=1 FL=1